MICITETNYEVIINPIVSEFDDTIVVTSADELNEKWIQNALKNYNKETGIYTAYLKDANSPFSDEFSLEEIDRLADNAQNNLDNMLIINSIIKKYINKSDIVGKTVESISTNTNTNIRLNYLVGAKSKEEIDYLNNSKSIIEQFNKQIKVENFIQNAISTTYTDGTFISYLRRNKDNYIADIYPIGVVEVSDYNINGEPILLFNIKELDKRLRKLYKSYKKKAMFFEDIKKEIESNYPKEVYDAHTKGDFYAKLDVINSGTIRIANMNKKYGLSPIFRALSPLSMLDTFDNSDRINSKAKSKKIIHQSLRKEVMGLELKKTGYTDMMYAHNNFMEAFKRQTVIVTTPPSVEKISYIEPKVEFTDINIINNYRSRALSTLGISFVMDSGSQSVSTASISVEQLLRTINCIAKQIEELLTKWYLKVLEDNKIPSKYCPEIKIIDSELLEFKLKKELATSLYTIFNCSLETSLSLLGINLNDEVNKRTVENENEIDKIFFPRNTSFTSSGEDNNTNNENTENNKKNGRPKKENQTNKTNYDNEYNKTRGKKT